MLSPNRTYYYRVKAINSTSESSYSDVVAVTTTNNAVLLDPFPASIPSVINLSSNKRNATLHIEQPLTEEYITQYSVTVSTNSDYSSPIYANRLLLTSSLAQETISGIKCYSVVLDKLSPATVYYYKISAINLNGSSANKEGSFTTLTNAQSPIAIGVSNLTAISAKLLWSRVSGASTYYLDISTSPTFASGNILTNAAVNEPEAFYELSLLEENTVYYFRVRALVGSSTSPNSNTVSFTTLDDVATGDFSYDLKAPIVKVAYTTNNAINLTWSEIRGNNGYVIDIATDSSFTSKVVDAEEVYDPYYLASSLTSNTAYFIRIATIGNFTNSPWVVLSASTKQLETALTAPALVTPTVIQSTGFIARWVKRSYATNYLLKITAPIARTYYVGDIDNFLITDLIPSTSYDLEIYGLSNNQISPASTSINVTTATVLPAITLSAVELSGTSAKLAWSTNSAYTTYYLSIWKEEGNYLGSNFFRNRELGNVSNFTVDVFLEANTLYSYRISAITANGEVSRSSIGTFTTLDFGTRISLRNYSILSSNRPFNQLWVSASSLFDTYVDGYPMTFAEPITESDISSLLRQGLYYVKVRLNSGAFSNTISTSTLQSKLFPLQVFEDRIEVKWNPLTSTSLRLQVYADNIPVFPYPLEQATTTDFYIINSPIAGTEYKVVMEEFDSSLGVYVIADELTVEYPDFTIAESPSVVSPTVTAISYDLFTAVSVEESADLYVHELYSNESSVPETIKVSESSSCLIPLNLNTSYTLNSYRVVGSSKSEPTLTSIISSPTFTPPSAISGSIALSFTVANDTEAELTWNDLANVDSYVVEVAETNTFNQIAVDVYVEYPTKRTAILRGLSSSVTYYARVYGVNAISLSSYSNTVSISTAI